MNMNWMKQKWVRVVFGVVIFVTLFFIKEWSSSSSNTPLTSDTTPLLPLSHTSIDKPGGLSQDKSLVLFVRNYPAKDICDEDGCYRKNEIWIKNNNTGEEKLLVRSGDVSEYSFANSDAFPFSSIANLSSPVFSLDNKKVYFMMNAAWVTSSAILWADVSDGTLHFVSDGMSLEVVSAGPYKGNLKVSKHKYYDPPNDGSYNHYYIITDSGKEIKDLGE